LDKKLECETMYVATHSHCRASSMATDICS